MTFVTRTLRSSLESAAMGADMWRAAAAMTVRRVDEAAPGQAIDQTLTPPDGD